MKSLRPAISVLLALGVLCLLSAADHARSQVLLQTLDTPNPQSGAQFGESLAMGDADGDGRADLLVGAPFEDVGANAQQGRAYLFSGTSGALLRTLDTPNPQADAIFGESLAMGDADADGKADLLVGARLEAVGSNFGQGRAYLFSSAPTPTPTPTPSPTPTQTSAATPTPTATASPLSAEAPSALPPTGSAPSSGVGLPLATVAALGLGLLLLGASGLYVARMRRG